MNTDAVEALAKAMFLATVVDSTPEMWDDNFADDTARFWMTSAAETYRILTANG